MAVSIRLSRVGTKKTPYYRIVVADSRMPRDGRFIEQVGNYSPLREDKRDVVNKERALYWLNQGARPTDTVKDIFKRTGVSRKK